MDCCFSLQLQISTHQTSALRRLNYNCFEEELMIEMSASYTLCGYDYKTSTLSCLNYSCSDKKLTIKMSASYIKLPKLFYVYKMSLSFEWWWQFELRFSLHGIFWKITSGFNLTRRWETGNYNIIFWSLTSEAEFSSQSAVLFLYVCLILL